MGKLEGIVVSALRNSSTPLTLAEIAEKTKQPEKKVFRELRSLFEKGLIDSQDRRYKLCKPE